MNKIKRDFGVVTLKNKTDIRQQIKDHMRLKGYAVDRCDVCSVDSTTVDNKDVVLFKFVHFATPTMATEPYYKIEFIYE
jgi:hypothetical protein